MCIVSHIGIQCGHWVCSVFVCGGCSYTNMPTERRPLLLLGQRNAQQLPLKSTSHNYQFFSISVFIFALHAFSRFYFFLLRLHSVNLCLSSSVLLLRGWLRFCLSSHFAHGAFILCISVLLTETNGKYGKRRTHTQHTECAIGDTQRMNIWRKKNSNIYIKCNGEGRMVVHSCWFRFFFSSLLASSSYARRK